MLHVSTNVAVHSYSNIDTNSRKRKRKPKIEKDRENELPLSPSLVVEPKRKVRRRVQRIETTPEPVKQVDVLSSPTKLSKYWGERAAEMDDGFPFHLVDTTRVSYYLLMICPPKLIQEECVDDPFKLVVATMLLNKTTGRAAIPIFRILMSQWPTPSLMCKVPVATLEHILHPLGLSNVRAKRLIDLSLMYLSNPPTPDILHKSRAKGEPPTPISHLPGVGKYAIDSYRIFCVPGDEWKQVRPTDKPLCRYLKWKWAVEEYRIWTPEFGDVIEANENYYYEMIHKYCFKTNLTPSK